MNDQDAPREEHDPGEPEGLKSANSASGDDVASEIRGGSGDAPSNASGKRNPLRRYSLLGRADELEAKAAETTPLLGDFIMKGQATMIYAAPNTGKTLIMLHLVLEAIEQGRIDADRVFYVNADDSSNGLAVKARLLQDVGAHMLVPGL